MQIRARVAACLWGVALSAGVAQAQQTGVDFQSSTDNVLAALGVPAAPPAEPVVAPSVVVNGELITIIGEAMASGKSSSYINALVMEAHSDGQIEVSTALTDGAGAVDSAAMLAAVVNAAIAAQPAQQAVEVAALATVAIAGTPEEIVGRTHTVIKGDTLNRIAQNYYGASGTYQQILQANPEITNANLISVGMVLRIPE